MSKKCQKTGENTTNGQTIDEFIGVLSLCPFCHTENNTQNGNRTHCLNCHAQTMRVTKEMEKGLRGILEA